MLMAYLAFEESMIAMNQIKSKKTACRNIYIRNKSQLSRVYKTIEKRLQSIIDDAKNRHLVAQFSRDQENTCTT